MYCMIDCSNKIWRRSTHTPLTVCQNLNRKHWKQKTNNGVFGVQKKNTLFFLIENLLFTIRYLSCFENCWIFSFLLNAYILEHIDRISILLWFTLRVVNKQRRYVVCSFVHRVHIKCHRLERWILIWIAYYLLISAILSKKPTQIRSNYWNNPKRNDLQVGKFLALTWKTPFASPCNPMRLVHKCTY